MFRLPFYKCFFIFRCKLFQFFFGAWYECKCYPGNHVSREKVMRHRKEENKKRIQVGRGIFKPGTRVRTVLSDLLTFLLSVIVYHLK